MPRGRETEQTEEFYETLQDQIDKINKNDYIVVAGDYNARVGNIPIDGNLGTNREITTNSNGHKLKEFASVNELKVTNTFFRHKKIHKMTWIVNKVRTEIILKIYNTLFLPTFLYGSENWTLTALQRRRIEVAEMKLLRLLAGYTLYDHKTNDYIRRDLRTTGILDKIDEYRRNWLLHLQRMPQNPIPLKIIYRLNYIFNDKTNYSVSMMFALIFIRSH